MKKFLTIALAISSLFCSAQQAQFTERQGKSIASGTNGFAEYLPANYELSKFPAVIFLHGIGERGNGTNELLRVSSIGPTSYVKWTSWRPDVIMIAPQWSGSTWPSAEMVDQVVNYVIANYRVNKDQIYLTGLSMGGGAAWDYASSTVARATKLAALLPVCGYSGGWNGGKVIADAGLPVFATHNNGDPTVPYSMSVNWVNNINAAGVKPAAVLKTFISGTHNAWDSTYNPALKPFQGKLNWLEWLLQYNRGNTSPPVIIPPVDSPKTVFITPLDDRFLKSSKGWAQTATDIYGSPKTIAGTSLQQFYNGERWGVFSYDVPVTSGSYTVKLYFAELFHNSAGRRVFNVDLEGSRVLSNFDILANVPKFTALERSFPVIVNDGVLNIAFTASVDNAKVTGIEIIPGNVKTYSSVIEIRDSATGSLLKTYTDQFPAPVKVVVK